MDWLTSIAADTRLQTLLALIVVDIVLGIAAALKSGTFAWAEVGRFYRSTVLPLFLGYAVVRLATPYIAIDLLGDGSAWFGEALITLFWAAGVAQLVASVAKSIAALGITIGKKT